MECRPNCESSADLWLGPLKEPHLACRHRDEDETRTELRYAEIRSVKELPIADISELIEAVQNPLTVRRKPGCRETTDVLQHHGSWPEDCDLLDCPSKKIALVRGPQLLTSS
jgi:hypothetical protein